MDNKRYIITFGKVLQKMRLKKGLSQEDLALDCDLDRTFISMLERGLRQPSLTTIIKTAKTLQIKPSRLLAEIEKQLK